ncbi:MAG: hypothetical protein JJE21_03780 [Spirochaetaceae bacterium]|nr:hypothetical protein [Spirochaetaceae bacterium]
MIVILRIIIVAIFAVLVFVPRATVGVLNYWLIFIALFVVTAYYIYLQFYVSKKKISKLLKNKDFYSIYCSLVPEKEEGSFIYGRLVVYNSMVLLYGIGKKGIELKWSEELSQIESINFQKVSSNKKGFVISTFNRGDIQFSSSIKEKDQGAFISSVGLEFDEE